MELINGDCLDEMKKIPDGGVDLVLTDPPYELGFMGKSWDSTGIANNVEVWKEALRTLKPGGYLIAFSGTRTYHRMASAIEDAGFEVRDMIEWVYGSGFPKSLNIGKAVDKLQGNEREVVGKDRSGSKRNSMAGDFTGGEYDLTKGTSEWEGWGTALKPAHEPICMARKPLSEKTVAENCLKWGTGGIDVDGSRVGTEERFNAPAKAGKDTFNCSPGSGTEYQGTTAIGRFPANLIHDNSKEVRGCFPDVKGSKGSGLTQTKARATFNNSIAGINRVGYEDNGNASRFFKSIIYTAKASKSERNMGCEGLEKKNNMRINAPRRNEEEKTANRMGNHHPTVKPIALMEYLAKMCSMEGATILDPFMGSGTTGVACKNLNRNFIGIELDRGYYEIAKKRILETA